MNINRILELMGNPRVGFTFLAFVLLAFLPVACRQGDLHEAGPFSEPVQQELDHLTPLGVHKDFEFWATDSYQIDAVILSRERYWFDAESKISPVDFLLGWGPVTLEPNISKIKWSQSGRWGNYRYNYDDVTIDQRTIATHTANTHIIPDPDQPGLRRELLGLKRGDAVRLTGYLVKVEGKDGWKWNSSRRRTDTGDGACEVMFVTSWEPLD